MSSEVATAIRKLRPEFAHLETHPFQQGDEEAGPSIRPPQAPVATAPKAPIASTSNAGQSRPNKFHFWYIGTSLFTHLS